MTATKTRLASVDIGESGTPGTSASKIVARVHLVRQDRYEVSGYVSVGSNQGYYQENYSYGPWRGRGATIAEARDAMLNVVPADHRDDMARATLEAMYEAEDAEFRPV